MDKRYQIFISSTFSDLKEERNKVMQTIMSLDCIPAGMELFPAMDEEQFEFIKRIIDDCDYYLLIVGARYGSMDEHGVSYTEKEYDYAVSKGIPVMAFLHNDLSLVPLGKADLDDELRKKLEYFRKKVETGRLIQYWKNADDLNAKVAVSLPKTIKMIPRIGWIRANLMTSSESLQEMNNLRKEIDMLREYKQLHEKETSPINTEELASLDDEIILHKGSKTGLTWKELFIHFAPTLTNAPYAFYAEETLEKIFCDLTHKSKITVNPHDINILKVQFISLGLIEVALVKIQSSQPSPHWRLTPKGNKVMCDLVSVKKEKRK